MKGKNKWLIILITILLIIVLVLGGYIVYDKLLSKESVKPSVSIKLDDSKDYVYDADYSSEYSNNYKEFSIGGEDKTITNNDFGIHVEYSYGLQKLSDLKVPYMNINTYYAGQVNGELKNLYKEFAEKFDKCALKSAENGESCSQILTYRVYKYNSILSVVVIEGYQSSSPIRSDYKTYNFDLNTGNEIKYDEMVEKLGYDKNTLLDKEKQALKNKLDEHSNSIDLNNDCVQSGVRRNCYTIAYDLLEKSINDNTILYFAGNDGKLNLLMSYNDGSLAQNSDLKYLFVIDK